MCGPWAKKHLPCTKRYRAPCDPTDVWEGGSRLGKLSPPPHNLPAPFYANILWTEQKWQNQSITPEPTQRGIERLTEIDDTPAGFFHWFGRPSDWNRQRFIGPSEDAGSSWLPWFFYVLLHIYSQAHHQLVVLECWFDCTLREELALCSHLHDASEITRMVSDVVGQDDHSFSPACKSRIG